MSLADGTSLTMGERKNIICLVTVSSWSVTDVARKSISAGGVPTRTRLKLVAISRMKAKKQRPLLHSFFMKLDETSDGENLQEGATLVLFSESKMEEENDDHLIAA